jgi:hypothetical protein
MWHETDGVLSFEWTMLASLLTVGVVAGMASVRDAVTDEMADLSVAMTSLDQSYRIQGPLVISVHTPDFYNGWGGSYRVNEFQRSGVSGGGLMGFSGSTASGSVFLDAPSRIVRSRLRDQTAPADGAVPPPGTPVPPPEAQGAFFPDANLDQ